MKRAFLRFHEQRKHGDLRVSVDKSNDVSKYTKVYEDFKNLHSDDFLQLITEAETQEEKNFFETVWNYLLQEKQKKVIERNLF